MTALWLVVAWLGAAVLALTVMRAGALADRDDIYGAIDTDPETRCRRRMETWHGR